MKTTVRRLKLNNYGAWVLRVAYNLNFYVFLYCCDGGMPVSLLKKAEK